MNKLEPIDVIDIEQMDRADVPAIFAGFREQMERLRGAAESLTVTDSSQTTQMKLARQVRLDLRQIRLAVEIRRKELTESALRRKQNIDLAAKKIRDAIEPLEARMLEQEDFARLEQEREEQERRTVRHAAIAPYLTDPVGIDLEKMTSKEWSAHLTGMRMMHEARLAREKAEAEAREKREAEEAAERERMRQENRRLLHEAAQRETAAKAERAIIDAERARERGVAAEKQRQADALAAEASVARKKAEREADDLRRKHEAAEKARAKAASDAAREARRKAAAPDRQKVDGFADAIYAVPRPLIADTHFADDIEDRVRTLCDWIHIEAGKMEELR